MISAKNTCSYSRATVFVLSVMTVTSAKTRGTGAVWMKQESGWQSSWRSPDAPSELEEFPERTGWIWHCSGGICFCAPLKTHTREGGRERESSAGSGFFWLWDLSTHAHINKSLKKQLTLNIKISQKNYFHVLFTHFWSSTDGIHHICFYRSCYRLIHSITASFFYITSFFPLHSFLYESHLGYQTPAGSLDSRSGLPLYQTTLLSLSNHSSPVSSSFVPVGVSPTDNQSFTESILLPNKKKSPLFLSPLPPAVRHRNGTCTHRLMLLLLP